MRRNLLVIFILTAQIATAAPARDDLLQRCITLNKTIERYTKLRRGGGSAAQMERWRASRQRARDEFQALRCHKLGRQLRAKG